MFEPIVRYSATRCRRGQASDVLAYPRDFVWIEAEVTVLTDTATASEMEDQGWYTAEQIKMWPGGAEALTAWYRRDPSELIAIHDFWVAENLSAPSSLKAIPHATTPQE
jgi:hypothetical protein